MSKLTLSVSKVFKNGKYHKHYSAKPHWRRYYYDTDEEKFGAEYVSSIKAIKLKLNIWRKRKFICPECGLYFEGLIKNGRGTCDCPNCP